MDPRLLITNVGYTLSLILTVGLALVVLVKGRDRRLSVLFFLMSVALAVFEVSHLLGINVFDSHFSRQILMFNLSNIFISIFLLHWILALIGVVDKRALSLIVVYATGIGLFIFFLIFPDTFLLDSTPKLYLPNYYVPGKFDWLMRLYFVLVGLYGFIELVLAIVRSTDPVEKNRFTYAFWATIFGVVVGYTATFLVYDIPVDPIWSMFLSLYILPFSYAMLKYDLMDIRIIAKRALAYALAVGTVSICISFLSFSNDVLIRRVPGFPGWLLPSFSAMVAVTVAVFVWRKLKEADVLKYEFITIITHKFRTPLTHIKWATENLLPVVTMPEQKKEVENIRSSVDSLVDLTNLLVTLSNSEFSFERYRFEAVSFNSLIEDCLTKNMSRIKRHGISVQFFPGDKNLTVKVDKEKIGFVVHAIIENALAYTPQGGVLTVRLEKKGKNAVCDITDTGIGISRENLPLVFSKFFRASNAKKADTEGMGIGLYMGKIIVNRHNGSLSVFSSGEGKGSTFSIALPIEKGN